VSSGWIQTYTGRQFFPCDPKPTDFDIHDIAHSLGLQCRFNGHCKAFYSVAEHSVRVSRICSEQNALWGLLHDLGEAYLGDMPRPVKLFFPDFTLYEERLLQAACETFGLVWPMPPEVKAADDRLLSTEARDLMGPLPEPWTAGLVPLDERIEPWSPVDAERAFLQRFEELSGI
jgi:hypothetical protein